MTKTSIPTQKDIHNHPTWPYITFLVILPLDHFRSNIVGLKSWIIPYSPHSLTELLVDVEFPRCTKIDNLQSAPILVRFIDQILRFDIPLSYEWRITDEQSLPGGNKILLEEFISLFQQLYFPKTKSPPVSYQTANHLYKALSQYKSTVHLDKIRISLMIFGWSLKSDTIIYKLLQYCHFIHESFLFFLVG